MDIKGIFDNLKVGAVASDANFNIIYINKRGKELSKLKGVLNAENLVGSNIQNRREGAHTGGQLCAAGIRHRRGDGRPCP
jgi:hypothetical protein